MNKIRNYIYIIMFIVSLFSMFLGYTTNDFLDDIRIEGTLGRYDACNEMIELYFDSIDRIDSMGSLTYWSGGRFERQRYIDSIITYVCRQNEILLKGLK